MDAVYSLKEREKYLRYTYLAGLELMSENRLVYGPAFTVVDAISGPGHCTGYTQAASPKSLLSVVCTHLEYARELLWHSFPLKSF